MGIPYNYNRYKYSFVFKFYDTSLPYTSVNRFRHIVNPFNELLFCTFEIRTFI